MLLPTFELAVVPIRITGEHSRLNEEAQCLIQLVPAKVGNNGRRSVMKVFVLEGLIIGAIGTVVGLVLGYAACFFVETVGIRLDAEVYYIDKLPVRIDGLQFAAVAGLAVLLSYLATIYPAMRASRLPPVDGLRNE